MDELTRKKLETGTVLDFCRAHPDSEPDSKAAVPRLEARLARADQLILQEGANQKRSGFTPKQKRKLRRTFEPPESSGKIIPLRKNLPDDPDPAA